MNTERLHSSVGASSSGHTNAAQLLRRVHRSVRPCSASPQHQPQQLQHQQRRGVSVAALIPSARPSGAAGDGSNSPATAAKASPSSTVAAAATTEEQKQQGIIGCQPCMDGTLAVPLNEDKIITRFVAETLLPTRHGKFRVRGYKHSVDGGLTFTEPTAIISGVVEGQNDVPLRVHDACFTSEVLGSLKCDCAEQLAIALERINKYPPGIVIYLQQEGRGIGLANKIAAYSLQERGLDTVDANRALGLPDDCREYTSVRNIIKEMGIKSIQLITNNPRKINQLKALGIDITGRLPCIVEAANEFNVGYLQAKRDRMDHLLEEGQFCYWNHDGEPTTGTPANANNGGMGLPNNLVSDAQGRVVLDGQALTAGKQQEQQQQQ